VFYKILLFLLMFFFNGSSLPNDFPANSVEHEKTVVTFEDESRNVLATGADIDSITVAVGELGNYSITGKFKDPERLEKITQELLGEQLFIYCDSKIVISPTVALVITTGEFQISANYTLQEAEELADKFRNSME